MFNDQGRKLPVDDLINRPDINTNWIPGLSNNQGHPAQGNDNNIQSTGTIQFFPFDQVPTKQNVPYCALACDHCP